MSQFNAPHFQTPEAARAYLEKLRWGGERVCPHCGSVNLSFATKKAGVYRCSAKECRKDFSVTTKSVMESSHIKLHIWLQAFYLMASSKKGVSSHQLHRALGVTYKTAWFLSHRIREAMSNGGLLPPTPMGGEGAIVEADETYFGPVAKDKVRKTTTSGRPFTKSGKTGPSNKRAIVSLVERGGSVRSFHVAVADGETVRAIVKANVARETRLHTDESRLYHGAELHFASGTLRRPSCPGSTVPSPQIAAMERRKATRFLPRTGKRDNNICALRRSVSPHAPGRCFRTSLGRSRREDDAA